MGVNSIWVIFKAIGLDEISHGENVERKEQQAPEGVLWVSKNRGRGEEGLLAVRLRLPWASERGEDSMADRKAEGREVRSWWKQLCPALLRGQVEIWKVSVGFCIITVVCWVPSTPKNLLWASPPNSVFSDWHIGSVNSATVGIFTPWKLANPINWFSFSWGAGG